MTIRSDTKCPYTATAGVLTDALATMDEVSPAAHHIIWLYIAITSYDSTSITLYCTVHMGPMGCETCQPGACDLHTG
jgi:hypothetical protein